ncbi:cytochrome P450 [Xylariaceae sp. FL1272]|nr:cytochrome P450 [Xylariaceae sp. FL1272]
MPVRRWKQGMIDPSSQGSFVDFGNAIQRLSILKFNSYSEQKMASIQWLLVQLAIGLSVACAVVGLYRWVTASKLPPLPPGPKGYPLVGNISDLPPPGTLEAKFWLKHKAQFGPLSSVTVLGQSLVIINDPQLAIELFEKRSAKYSSRPKQIFAGEMVGWEKTLGLSPYNKRFRAMRKNLNRVIGSSSAAANFHKLQYSQVAHFLLHVLRNPDDLAKYVRRSVGATVLDIAYGYTAETDGDDVLINMVHNSMDNFARAAVPGAFMVDILPFLKYMPTWMPGTGFKRTAQEWAAELLDIAEKPYAYVKYRMSTGTNKESFLSRLIDMESSNAEEIDTNKWSAMSLYSAGADTTVSAISCFFLAMTLHPDVQKRAQEEIDRVVGCDRLTTMADREKLLYVNAVVKETLRWHPVAPMGIPHQNTDDDVCEGYIIPKGSMLFANIWHFTHDPERYHDPFEFKPERFLQGEAPESGPEPDPKQFVFGFGRRICPGNILADNTLFLTIAQSLTVFSIEASKTGMDTNHESMFQAGVVSHPTPFSSNIKPRSPHHEAMIKSLEQEYPWPKSDGDILRDITN